MGVGCPCPPVCNGIVTPCHLFSSIALHLFFVLFFILCFFVCFFFLCITLSVLFFLFLFLFLFLSLPLASFSYFSSLLSLFGGWALGSDALFSSLSFSLSTCPSFFFLCLPLFPLYSLSASFSSSPRFIN